RIGVLRSWSGRVMAGTACTGHPRRPAPEERLTTTPIAPTARPARSAGPTARRMPTLALLVAWAVVAAAFGSVTSARVALGADPAGAGPPLPRAGRPGPTAPPPPP